MPLTEPEIEDILRKIEAALRGTPYPAAAPATSGPQAGLKLTFEENFDTLDFTRWSTVYRWNQAGDSDSPNIRGCSIPPNDERQWYINRNYPPTFGLKPWRIENGELVIQADVLPDHLRPLLGYDQSDVRNLGSYTHYSGLLHTGSSFQQCYGYFEADMKWSKGKGLWPAFWLLSAVGKPPELDIVEVLGDRPDRLFHTIHTASGGPSHVESFLPLDGGFHRIGTLWTKETIRFFVDDREVGAMPTPPDFHVPMYLILNLAVGGENSWPGAPDYFTHFPAEMRVRSVRAWG